MEHDQSLGRLRNSVFDILQEIEVDPAREGIESTPIRVARMWLEELTAGYAVDIPSLFKLFPAEGYDGIVTVRDIPVTSVCEHHLVPIVGFAHIGYFPGPKGVVGLSKLPRVVNAFARRLQVQERLTEQIIDAIDDHMEPRGVCVVVSAEHLCMTMRGVQAPGTKTVTSTARGLFIEEQGTKDEFMGMINGH
jgi:GTP cyclohydrolase I